MTASRAKQFAATLELPHPKCYTILPKLYLAAVSGENSAPRSLMVPGLKMGEFMSYAKKLGKDRQLKQQFPRRARKAKPIQDNK